MCLYRRAQTSIYIHVYIDYDQPVSHYLICRQWVCHYLALLSISMLLPDIVANIYVIKAFFEVGVPRQLYEYALLIVILSLTDG